MCARHDHEGMMSKRKMGRRQEREIAERYESETGHPMGGSSPTRSASEMPVDMPRNTDPQREQHARKGHAQSPRELTLNQPEKKREGHR